MDSVFTTKSVVKISCGRRTVDLFHPWKIYTEQRANGTGFVIRGKMIITNAHVLGNPVLVEVIKHGSPKKYIAEVKAIGRKCDLAILMVQSKEFWKDMNPLELGGIPSLEESVVVIGYPQGCHGITKGVVSRIILIKYPARGAGMPLKIQIDAAVKPGNSGSPVCTGNKVVGVVYASDGDKIGYAIPTSVVQNFMTDVEKRKVI